MPAPQPVAEPTPAPVPQPAPEPAPQPAPAPAEGSGKKKGKGAIVAVAVVALLLVVGIGVFFFTSRSGEEAPDEPEGQTGMDGTEADVDVLEAFSDTSSADAIAEVLGYVDEAEETISDANSELTAINDKEYYIGKFRDQANVLEKLVSDLTDLREKAGAVEGLDATFAAARTEYFGMLQDSQSSYLEVWNFWADYFDFYEEQLGMRPPMDNYDSLPDYYNALYAWYGETKEAYAAIDSCPGCLEVKWAKYGDNLDLVENVVYKMNLAAYYNDWLRYASADSMLTRFDTVEELEYQELLDCLSGEQDHVVKQRRVASALAEELHSYAEMSEEDREGYEFEYIRSGKIYLDYEAVDTIYPSLYNTYDAFAIIKTGTVSGTRKITVEAEIPGFTQPYTETFNLTSSYQEIYIKPPALTGDLDVTAAKDAQISLKIYEQDGTLLEAKSFPVTIKSKYDVEWYTDEYGIATKDNILCFLTPEAKAITDLKYQAINEISSMTGGQMESFVGYQGNAWNNHYVGTYLQAAGIMRALNTLGVRYTNDIFSLSGSNQHILFPADVLEQKTGLCIETTLVVASALQSAGMHTFLVLPTGHAQVAVEIWNGSGNDTTGTGEYFLIETTMLTDDSNNANIFIDGANTLLSGYGTSSYPIQYLSASEWYDYILNNDAYIIDCDDAGTLGLTQFAN